MHESELLSHIYARNRETAAGVVVGPGDDAAVVRLGDETLLLTVDQLVEGRHHAPGAPARSVAHKALARGLSDIAAMGGSPRFALAAASLPAGYPDADDLFDAMHTTAAGFGCPLVGGDIAGTDGPALLSVTVVGQPHPARGPVLRSTAAPGDSVWVTGTIGGAFASGRHLSFTPRLAEALRLCDTLGPGLTAMMDLSDGLGRDAGRLAESSGVRLELTSTGLPLSPGVTDPLGAVADGEDYELLFTVRGDHAAITGATRIGTVTTGSGAGLSLATGQTVEIAALGWDHEL